MKIIALIPFWENYKTPKNILTCKSLVEVSGRSLINRTIEITNNVKLIDKTVIFTSSDLEFDCIDNGLDCELVERSGDLDSSQASIEDIIDGFLQTSDAEIIVLIHPRSPFIKAKTINECIEKVLTGEFDSAFTANSIQRHAWYKGRPLNYSTHRDTPALSKLEPIVIESSSIYVFTRELFKKTHHRIGKHPYIKNIGHFEGFEIDNKDDLIMAELIINAGLDKEAL